MLLESINLRSAGSAAWTLLLMGTDPNASLESITPIFALRCASIYAWTQSTEFKCMTRSTQRPKKLHHSPGITSCHQKDWCIIAIESEPQPVITSRRHTLAKAKLEQSPTKDSSAILGTRVQPNLKPNRPQPCSPPHLAESCFGPPQVWAARPPSGP